MIKWPLYKCMALHKHQVIHFYILQNGKTEMTIENKYEMTHDLVDPYEMVIFKGQSL